MTMRRGANAIEFALILVPFLFIAAGIADLSNFVVQMQTVSRAARDGARVGSAVIEGSDPTGDDIEAEAEAQVRLLLEEAGMPCTDDVCTVTTEWTALDGYMFVVVDVTYVYDRLVGLSFFVPDNVTAHFAMMTQQQ